MQRFACFLFATLLATAALAGLSSAQTAPLSDEEKIARAKDVFERYVTLMDAFDPAVGQLYADDARVHTVMVSPGGEERKAETSGRDWRNVVRQVLAAAKLANNRVTFSDVKARVDGENVRIDATRHEQRNDFESDFWMLVGPDASGEWKILEAYTVTRP